MQGAYVLDGFQLKDDIVFHDDVRTVAAVERGPIVVQWQIDLAPVENRVPVELVARAVFISAFEEAWAEASTRMERPMIRWVRSPLPMCGAGSGGGVAERLSEERARRRKSNTEFSQSAHRVPQRTP